LIQGYPEFKNSISSMTISPDSKTAIIACHLRKIAGVRDWATVKVWDIQKGEVKIAFGKEEEGFSRPFLFSPNSKIAFGHYSQENNVSAVLWTVATGKVHLTFDETAKSAQKAAFSPKGDQLLIVDGEGYVCRFDAKTGKELWKTLKRGGSYFVISPDAKLVLKAHEGGSYGMEIWDGVEGNLIRKFD
jgi:WD40 repeat protein